MSLHLDISNPRTEEKLAAAAHSRGIDVVAVIDLAIDYLPPVESIAEPDKIRTGGEIAREIGFVKGLPSDLSTNPGKYMKGFGQTKNSNSTP